LADGACKKKRQRQCIGRSKWMHEGIPLPNGESKNTAIIIELISNQTTSGCMPQLLHLGLLLIGGPNIQSDSLNMTEWMLVLAIKKCLLAPKL
jgi:hypothetical protein